MTKRIEPRIFYDSIDWTVADYHRMVETGLLAENAPVELLNGKIIPMSPVGRFHAACVSNLQELFILSLQKTFSYRTQDPVAMLDLSEPEPDFVIAKRDVNNYAAGHPSTKDIVVLIEVSDSTLEKDRKHKLPIYANAGVKEYWIVNLIERQIEVYTAPEEDGTYGKKTIHLENTVFEHGQLGTIVVDDILPGVF